MTVRVRFLPGEKVVEVEQGVTVLEAARIASIVIESPCDGAGTCGKCKVRLTGASPDAAKEASPSCPGGEKKRADSYLACQTEILADVTVERMDCEEGQSIDALREGEALPIALDPFVRKEFVESEARTLVYTDQTIAAIEEGDTRDRIFGLAVDIGTTTLVASLVDLAKGKEISSASSLNPQSLSGQDVLSRIKLASTGVGLHIMHAAFAAEMNRMIDEILAASGVARGDIHEAVYSGNTCMLHLACAIDPSGLGRYPYRSALQGDQYLPAHALGLAIAPQALVYLPPIISGFVGADITSGILATGFHTLKGATLFIDIGTNGEMVLCHEGRTEATSTAAGPAFEGMSIACGMRAGDGAIESATVDESGDLALKTIGDGEPRGICGSGLLDIAALLVRHGLVTREGRLVQPDRRNGCSSLAARLGEKDGTRVFSLTDSVYVSQRDIRQVQLAKGAIRTGIELLLKSAGMDASEVDTVLVAGAFGYPLEG